MITMKDKISWHHTEKKMASHGTFQCTTWLVWNKFTTLKCYYEDGKKFGGCHSPLGRVVSYTIAQLLVGVIIHVL